MRKKYYRQYPQNKLHHIPGGISFGWFKCTFTQKDFIVFRGIRTGTGVSKCWKSVIGPNPPDESGEFMGLHVAMSPEGDKDTYRGSALFLSTRSRSTLAHEIQHAVCRCFDYLNIHDEEARCLALSSYMEQIQNILKLKDE